MSDQMRNEVIVEGTPQTHPDGGAVRVAVAFHSGFGHTARQANAVARGASSVPGVDVESWSVAELTEAGWAALDAADAIIFGSPTYMGSSSAAFQQFAEETSASGRWTRQDWSGKLAAGFTNSRGLSGDKLNVFTNLAIFAAQHGMIWVSLGQPAVAVDDAGNLVQTGHNRIGGYLGAMAQSDIDAGPDIAPPAVDPDTAEHLGRRVAEVALQFVRGRTPARASVAG